MTRGAALLLGALLLGAAACEHVPEESHEDYCFGRTEERIGPYADMSGYEEHRRWQDEYEFCLDPGLPVDYQN